MKKKMIIFIFLIILVLGFCFTYYEFNQNRFNKTIANSDNTMIAFYREGPGGGYEKSSNTTWPTSGYVINEERSGCIDSNGNDFGTDALRFDSTTHKVTINVTRPATCYLYFDIDRGE